MTGREKKRHLIKERNRHRRHRHEEKVLQHFVREAHHERHGGREQDREKPRPSVMEEIPGDCAHRDQQHGPEADVEGQGAARGCIEHGKERHQEQWIEGCLGLCSWSRPRGRSRGGRV